MNKKACILLAVFALSFPALAQEPKPLTLLERAQIAGERLEEPIFITLPLNEDEARFVVLHYKPGTVLASEGYEDEDDFFYEFEIEQSNGTVLEVDINADHGWITSVLVNSLGEGAPLPRPEFTLEQAREVALDHVRKKTSGNLEPEIVKEKYRLEKRLPVHDITVKKRRNTFRILINGRTGKIINVKRN